LLGVLIAALTLAPVTVSAQRNSKDGAGLTVPFTTNGTVNGASQTITGTLTITRFAAQQGALVAIGTVAATVPDGTGVRSFITQVALPVTATSGAATGTDVFLQQVACEILHLELGPLDLDLLGLVVHLDQIVLDITAVPGAGNLLGNLLCAIAGLLDGGSPLTQILNQLVGLLNQLIEAL
jgi:hypothetical protein